ERLRSAIQEMDEGHLEEASVVLEDLLRAHPNNGIVLHELGLSYRLMRRPEKAITLWMPFRSRLTVLTLAGLASALDEAGKPEEAIAFLREEIQRHPNAGILYSELATTLRQAGKDEEARKLYERAIDVDPAFPAAWLHLTNAYATTRSRGLSLLYGETFRILE